MPDSPNYLLINSYFKCEAVAKPNFFSPSRNQLNPKILFLSQNLPFQNINTTPLNKRVLNEKNTRLHTSGDI